MLLISWNTTLVFIKITTLLMIPTFLETLPEPIESSRVAMKPRSNIVGNNGIYITYFPDS